MIGGFPMPRIEANQRCAGACRRPSWRWSTKKPQIYLTRLNKDLNINLTLLLYLMSERQTGFHEDAPERLESVSAKAQERRLSARTRLRRLAAAGAAAIAVSITPAAAENRSHAPAVRETVVDGDTPPAPRLRPDRLERAVGREAATEIRLALDACLEEVHLIVADLHEMGDDDEADFFAKEGENTCEEQQQRDTRLALARKQEADLRTRLEIAQARIAASHGRQGDLRADIAETRAERAAIEARTAEKEALAAELATINDRLTRLLVNEALCDAQGGDCAALREEIDALFQRSRELLPDGTDQEPAETTVSVVQSPASTRTIGQTVVARYP